ncbi:hypothetical protein A499_25178 [Niallia nealsonii AAU1]|nr:hypothetical protein A499_25178 [Niallia nealsonii AAU1]
MGLFNKLSKIFATEMTNEVLKTPAKKEKEKGQKEADKLGRELGEKLEFVEKMTQKEYDELMRKENKEQELLYQRVDKECKRICDRVYDLYMDFLDGDVSRTEMYKAFDKAKDELDICVDLAMDRNGHNLEVISSTVLPAKDWIAEVEERMKRD